MEQIKIFAIYLLILLALVLCNGCVASEISIDEIIDGRLPEEYPHQDSAFYIKH
jgi:hypothetical protein